MRRFLPPVGFLLAALAVAQPAAADDPVGVPDQPLPPIGLPADPHARRSVPVAELPRHVKAADGQFTVFADYERPKDGYVPVYVVNRTAAAVPLEHQDGHLYLMMEHEATPGTWVRAQSHTYSWCGNSYGVRTLDPGRFVVTGGYRPAKGEKATVRYKFYGQKHTAAVSNAGSGLIDKAEVEKAAVDMMTIRTGSLDFLRKVALGEIKRTPEDRLSAVRQVYHGEFDPREVDRVLTAIARNPDAKLADEAGILLQIPHERRR